MEFYKISKLLDDLTVSKFVTRKWIKLNYLSHVQYSVNKYIRFKTPVLRSGLRDYSDACTIVKRKASINTANRGNKKLTFKNNAPYKN